MHPVPIRKSILLQIDKALVDSITTDDGFSMYLAPEYNYEQNVTVSGTVTSVSADSIGVSEGDEVAFSYHIISNREFPNTSDFFVPIAQGGSLRLWQNARGEKLRMMGHQGAISVFWTGVFFNSRGQFEPEKSIKGTESEVERWMHSNFKFGNCEGFSFRNLFNIGGQEYWKCSHENIFAKKVDDEIIAVGDRVICKFIEIPIPQRIKEIKGIKLPDKDVKVRLYDRAEIVSGGEDLGFKKGDIVSFDERYCEKYTLWGEEYALIKKHRIEGYWVEQN